ncbi:histidinol dehydrogenase [bacterium]|nr:histidinol dehydrogenase [bacterium]
MIPIIEAKNISSFLSRRKIRQAKTDANTAQSVSAIIDNVRKNGDAALIKLTQRFDGVVLTPDNITVSPDEIDDAVKLMGIDFMNILSEAAGNIRDFAIKSMPKSHVEWLDDGSMLGQKITPIESAAVYTPGGKAAYPSSLLMGTVPARAAGVERIIVLTPPDSRGNVNPAILAAARVAGVDNVFRIGGAQAIAAAAYGTASIKAVDKIVGPGNAFVAEAKRQVFGQVGIDMIAGPSEVVILADASADASYIAADMAAQAEHDPQASSILICSDERLAEAVNYQLKRQLTALSRQEIIIQSLNDWGAILMVSDLAEGISIINRLAPEHLGLHISDTWQVAGNIKNAGAIFLGKYSPEALGDYWAGPNHILPTAYTARFASPLGAEDFIKRQSLIAASDKMIKCHGNKIMSFAQKEGLDGHANAIKIRMD